MFVIIDSFTEYTWCIPLKTKYSEKITNEFPNILNKSKRHPIKIESDRGAEFYKSIFQNFLKSKKMKLYSKFTDKSPIIAKRVIRTTRNLCKKAKIRKKKC